MESLKYGIMFSESKKTHKSNSSNSSFWVQSYRLAVFMRCLFSVSEQKTLKGGVDESPLIRHLGIWFM